MLPSLPLERKDYKRDDLARASVKLRDPQGQPRSPPAPMRLKRTAAQAGLSAGPPVPEGLLCQVVMGLLPERAHSEPMWYNVCTKIANTAVANGHQNGGLRILRDLCMLCADKGQMPSLLRLCLAIIPNWALNH